MGTNLNFYPLFNNLFFCFRNALSPNQIQQKTCQIAKRIFRFLLKNQHAIAISLGSYMCIELGTVIAESLNVTDIDNLENCESIFCQEWSNTNRNETTSLFSLEFRCNPTLPDYYPFNFVEKCITDLCKYMKANGQNLYGCDSIPEESNVSLENEELVLESRIWKALCPKVYIRHSNSRKKLKAINSCIQNLCNYYHVFSPRLSPVIAKFCETSNQNRMNHLIKKLTKTVDQIEKKLETEDSWTRTSSIVSVVGGVLGVVGSIIAIGTTIFTYKAQVRNANVNPVVLNLRNIIPHISETNTALRIENAQNTVEESQHIEALDNLLSEVQDFTLEISEILDHVISYQEEGEGAELEATGSEFIGMGGLVLGYGAPQASLVSVVAAQASLSDNVINRITTIRKEGTEFLKKLGAVILERIPTAEEITTPASIGRARKKFKTIILPEQTFQLPKDLKENRILREYINDFISGPFTDYELTKVQANRLNGTFKDWNMAFCTYNHPDILFCRYPNNDTNPSTLLPTHYTNAIVRHNLHGLCYIILEDLWCNWTKIFQIFSKTISDYVIPTYSDCPWDLFPLRIEDENLLKINALGHCYNRSAIFEFEGI